MYIQQSPREARGCQLINTLIYFAISPGKSALCYYRLAVTGVLLGVGHKLKNVIIVSGDGAGDGAGEEGD